MPLIELSLDIEPESGRLPHSIDEWIAFARTEIRDFWDHHPNRHKTEYVECDFAYAGEAIKMCLQQQLLPNSSFLEWGCGFAVISGIASLLGLKAVGIEAEEFLYAAAQRLHRRAKLQAEIDLDAEIWQGNFLPRGSGELAIAEDPRISLRHRVSPAYETHESNLKQFGCVFCYAWPGEEHFLRSVFHRFAEANTLLILYRGPYQIEFYRK